MRVEVGVDGRAAASRFLEALYRSAPSDSFVEVRFSLPSGMGRRFHRVAELGRVARGLDGLASRTDVYVGVIPRRRRSGRRQDLVARASVVWVDCDTDESVRALDAFCPRPAIVVASGTAQNRHAYWTLRRAIDLDGLEQLNRRLALALGADVRCADAARILRPVGSANWKSGRPVGVRLLGLDDERSVEAEDLDRRLPVLGDRPDARARCVPHRTVGEDRLLALSPRVYVERLTGQRVGRSGKMRCPFHEDRTPSLHVYETVAEGWYCFGCGRGGSIYDFAAPLLFSGQSAGAGGAALRGRQFAEVRERLLAMFVGGREFGEGGPPG